MGRKRINLNIGYAAALRRWRKRIDGKLYYFGPAGCSEEDARKDLIRFLHNREATVETIQTLDPAVGTLAELYAQDCEKRIADGRLSRKVFYEYDRIIGEFVAAVGPARLVSTLGASDFGDMRHAWDQRVGVHALNHYVTYIRTMFTWGKDNNRIAAEPSYGRNFDGAARSEKRQNKTRTRERRGERKFTDEELRAIFAHPDFVGPLRASILLSLNCGFYSLDCADLLWGEVRVDGRITFIDRERRKTKIDQRAPLWPEVVEAIGGRGDDDARVLTQPNGSPLSNRANDSDWLAVQFDALYRDTGLKRAGIGYGTLKHTHSSAVGGHPDRVARLYVRGHRLEDEDVEGSYDLPDLKRLKAITDLARQRLYLRNAKTSGSAKRRPAAASAGKSRRSRAG